MNMRSFLRAPIMALAKWLPSISWPPGAPSIRRRLRCCVHPICNYLYVEDCVTLCLTVLTAPMITGAHTINASSGIGINLIELFSEMEVIPGSTLRRNYEIGRTADAKRVVMDSSMTRQKYGWSPTTSLHDGLETTWCLLTTTRR